MTPLEEFYRSLHARGVTQTSLAAATGSGRAHLSEVLANKPGHGCFTRRRLFPFLTAKEVRLLGWQEEFDRWRRSTRNIVPKSGA